MIIVKTKLPIYESQYYICFKYKSNFNFRYSFSLQANPNFNFRYSFNFQANPNTGTRQRLLGTLYLYNSAFFYQ